MDLYSATAHARQVEFASKRLNSLIIHTREVRVLGAKNASSSSTRVDVDAFVVLR